LGGGGFGSCGGGEGEEQTYFLGDIVGISKAILKMCILSCRLGLGERAKPYVSPVFHVKLMLSLLRLLSLIIKPLFSVSTPILSCYLEFALKKLILKDQLCK
jgi:hypothetical protein